MTEGVRRLAIPVAVLLLAVGVFTPSLVLSAVTTSGRWGPPLSRAVSAVGSLTVLTGVLSLIALALGGLALGRALLDLRVPARWACGTAGALFAAALVLLCVPIGLLPPSVTGLIGSAAGLLALAGLFAAEVAARSGARRPLPTRLGATAAGVAVLLYALIRVLGIGFPVGGPPQWLSTAVLLTLVLCALMSVVAAVTGWLRPDRPAPTDGSAQAAVPAPDSAGSVPYGAGPIPYGSAVGLIGTPLALLLLLLGLALADWAGRLGALVPVLLVVAAVLAAVAVVAGIIELVARGTARRRAAQTVPDLAVPGAVALIAGTAAFPGLAVGWGSDVLGDLLVARLVALILAFLGLVSAQWAVAAGQHRGPAQALCVLITAATAIALVLVLPHPDLGVALITVMLGGPFILVALAAGTVALVTARSASRPRRGTYSQDSGD